MTRTRGQLSQAIGAAALAFGLGVSPAHAVFLFQVTDLVSDGFVPAPHVDPDLINPWGVSFGPKTPFWVSDNGTGLATLYNGAGVKQGLVVTMPPASGFGTSAPTGQVFNGVSGGFKLTDGKPAVFLFASEDGAITGWNPGLGTNGAIAVNGSASGAVYKGLAIDDAGGHLFAANFRSGKLETYDQTFVLKNTATDPGLPAGYAPFDARVLNGQLYVTFALQNGAKHDDVAGPGHGFVDVFDLNGNFVKRLISRGHLNSPWGIEIAPASFGPFAGALLVGNFGDGTIGAYDPATSAFLGVLRDTHFDPIRLGDLWALTVGNGFNAGNLNSVYFTAGVLDEAHGLFGRLDALNVPEPATALLLLAGLGSLAAIRRRA